MTGAPEHDYVIVGAGPAGCVLAGRLSEDRSRSVLLLEAGPMDDRREIRVPAAFPRLFKTEVDWDYRTEPQPGLAGRRLYWPRGRVLGGSSSMNAMVHVRGHPRDYDGWAEAGCRGWRWEEVLPFFLRSEDYRPRGDAEAQSGAPDARAGWGRAAAAGRLRGRSGPLRVRSLRSPRPASRAFVDAVAASGVPRSSDVNGAELEGVELAQVTQSRGRRWSAADAYLRPALGRPNLGVQTGVRVTRILLGDDRGLRAVGVEALTGGRSRRVGARREVVVAAGAVNSPQLLMLSGIGSPAGLESHGLAVRRELPGVGRNLQDHVAAGVVVRATRGASLDRAESLTNLLRFLALRRGPLTSNVAEAVAFLRTAVELPAPDLELVFAPAAFVGHGLGTAPEEALTVGAVLLQPRSAGEVGLRSADPAAPPRIDPGYLTDPGGSDMTGLVSGLRRALRVLRTRPLSDYVAGPHLPDTEAPTDADLRELVRHHGQTLYHPVGTCRMGADPGAVVDERLRVRGVDGLRVVDASVMPRIVRGHTHWPTVMIAEKAATMIREDACS